jgi:predicted nucleotidyltransferase
MIPETVHTEILRRLKHAEREHHVRIVLAVESGSRAWGFASPNSDYDVRFIYARTPERYLSVGLEEQRDVIEYGITDDIDLNGWDVRKALRLFWKSNPAFIEWIQSPIIYIERGAFAASARRLLPTVYSRESGLYHYRSMAKTNYQGYLRADLVPLKKYFYVLRPLLAVRWIEKYGSAAPMEFHKLLHLLDDRPPLLAAIEALLQRKRGAPELGLAAPVPSISFFIEDELERLAAFALPRNSHAEVLCDLDAVFHTTLREAWV